MHVARVTASIVVGLALSQIAPKSGSAPSDKAVQALPRDTTAIRVRLAEMAQRHVRHAVAVVSDTRVVRNALRTG